MRVKSRRSKAAIAVFVLSLTLSAIPVMVVSSPAHAVPCVDEPCHVSGLDGTLSCDVKADDPHITNRSGQQAVVAKATIRWCSSDVDQWQATVYLYRCNEEPSGPEDLWWQYGCVTGPAWPYVDTSPTHTGTAKSPKPEAWQPYLEGYWWISCVVYELFGDNATPVTDREVSTKVFL